MKTRFLDWWRGLFTSRHKRLAQNAINTANEAIATCGRAIDSLKEVQAALACISHTESVE